MTTVVIFGSVIMAAIFFFLSLFFNAIASIIEALEKTIAYILSIVVHVILALLALEIIISIVANWGNIWSFIGMLVATIVMALFAIGIIMAIGGPVFEFVVMVLISVVIFIQGAIDAIANSCENCFNHFVCIIKKRTENG